jgi:hypothetical protein
VTADARIEALLRGARRRRLATALGFGVPAVVAIVVITARAWPGSSALAVGVLACAGLATGAFVALRGLDRDWVARRLDATWPDMEDSAALLARTAHPRSNLAHLQRARLERRLEDARTPDIRPPWPGRALAFVAGGAAIVVAGALLWPASGPGTRERAASNAVAGDAAVTRLRHARIDISPPAYTAAEARSEALLDVRAPQGSRLRWHLRLDPQPASAALAFHDGTRVALARDGDEWTGEHTLEESVLYRIVAEGAPPLADPRLHRLDAIPDAAPEIRVTEPDRSLTLLDADARYQDFRIEVGDDHAVGDVRLSVTLAQGSGEAIRFSERSIELSAEDGGDARRKRYLERLDLGALGIGSGDDAIVRVIARDRREPEPNVARSAAFLLRWPAPPSEDSAAMEGIVQDTMPAYFRSQRQIILDSEALVAERATLDERAFLSRSDALGVDQKILRLRYGQFLGEEFETRGAPASAVHDEGHPLPGAPAPANATPPPDHDAEPALPATGGFGSAEGILAEYGHSHDHAEAATLLDEPTKAILRTALDNMWQAEGALRLGQPEAALPYEYRALAAIKQVQQSTRIYLARVGLELPTVDEQRRLSGDREGLSDRDAVLAASRPDAAIVAEVWSRLDGVAAPDWDAFTAWLGASGTRVADRLGIIAAIDEVRRNPACATCRESLRRLLWPLLPTPATAIELRERPDAVGRAYLDAIDPGTAR